MLILFDHVTPRGIARFLTGHIVTRARERGWETLTNGDLLAEAERAGFDVFVTADKNIRYQQNLAGRRIAIIVPMAAGSIANRKDRGGGQFGYTRQLYRG